MSYDQFCDLAAIFVLAAILLFVQTVHMNFHAKSGLCSPKTEQVMLNLVLGTGGAPPPMTNPMHASRQLKSTFALAISTCACWLSDTYISVIGV